MFSPFDFRGVFIPIRNLKNGLITNKYQPMDFNQEFYVLSVPCITTGRDMGNVSAFELRS